MVMIIEKIGAWKVRGRVSLEFVSECRYGYIPRNIFYTMSILVGSGTGTHAVRKRVQCIL